MYCANAYTALPCLWYNCCNAVGCRASTNSNKDSSETAAASWSTASVCTALLYTELAPASRIEPCNVPARLVVILIHPPLEFAKDTARTLDILFVLEQYGE